MYLYLYAVCCYTASAPTRDCVALSNFLADELPCNIRSMLGEEGPEVEKCAKFEEILSLSIKKHQLKEIMIVIYTSRDG